MSVIDNLKKLKPTTPGMRFRSIVARDELYKGKPEKSLTKHLNKRAGRNNLGRITCRHRGGGSKKKYRIISNDDLPTGFFNVLRLEYDPNRTGRIALVESEETKNKYYVLAVLGLQPGMRFSHNVKDHYGLGSRMKLGKIPIGREICSISNVFGKVIYAKSAGTVARLVDIDKDKARIKLPSSELIELPVDCSATLGVVSNVENSNINHGKAGITRHRGRRPSVRGVAKNPVDHPHGGGEGKTSGGRHPVTPWGKGTKGKATVNKNKKNRRHIIKSRKKK
ncbi:MAG: 50S ribosomal protein L2 [Pseudomonadota bacterium]